MRSRFLALLLAGLAYAQQPAKPAPPPRSGDTSSRSTDTASDRSSDQNSSSSRSHIIDISPPKDDAKDHPESSSATAEPEDVQEFHKWNPMRAMKAVEVGDFYFKRKNYPAALSRYEEALEWKSNDAVATFRLAQCQEKLNQPGAARENYEAYLKILPDGPFALEAQQALDRLKTSKAEPGNDSAGAKPQPN